MSDGLIFNIQRHSIHDGPGIRTIIFLKGCPLSCLWCSNPESQSYGPDILYDPEKCISCGACLAVCPSAAISGSGNWDRDLCRVCGACADVCYAEARSVAGTRYSVEAAFAEVQKDAPFYARTGGGVTLSGGEPLSQSGFSAELLGECKAAGFSTAVETTGYAPWEDVRKLLPVTDLFLYDIKHTNAELHKKYTGVDNKLILDNLLHAGREKAQVIVRVPVVPGFNDSLEVLLSIRDTARAAGARELHLLPYHRYGARKYSLLGREYPMDGLRAAEKSEIQELSQKLETADMKVRVGG